MSKNFKDLEDRFTKKEQRQKQSIDEVMAFVRDKLNATQAKTIGSLDNLSSLVDSNYKLLFTKIETLEHDTFNK